MKNVQKQFKSFLKTTTKKIPWFYLVFLRRYDGAELFSLTPQVVDRAFVLGNALAYLVNFQTENNLLKMMIFFISQVMIAWALNRQVVNKSTIIKVLMKFWFYTCFRWCSWWRAGLFAFRSARICNDHIATWSWRTWWHWASWLRASQLSSRCSCRPSRTRPLAFATLSEKRPRSSQSAPHLWQPQPANNSVIFISVKILISKAPSRVCEDHRQTRSFISTGIFFVYVRCSNPYF